MLSISFEAKTHIQITVYMSGGEAELTKTGTKEPNKKNYSKMNILKCRKEIMVNLKRNTCLNSLVICMIGIEYCGALHL